MDKTKINHIIEKYKRGILTFWAASVALTVQGCSQEKINKLLGVKK